METEGEFGGAMKRFYVELKLKLLGGFSLKNFKGLQSKLLGDFSRSFLETSVEASWRLQSKLLGDFS
jgi:hypothetical protein